MTEAAIGDAPEREAQGPPRSTRLVRRAAYGVVGVLLLGGLAHAPFARSLLARVGGCPMGAPLSASELEVKRVAAVRKIQGSTPARARPAHGFALDAATRDDARAWAREHGATCTDEPGGAALRCASTGTGGIDLFFQFGPDAKLKALDVMRESVPAAQAAELARAEIERLTREAGEPSKMHGEMNGTYLAGPLHQVNAEFRFSDYAADVTATNTGADGVMVRMQYRSIPKT